MHGSYAKVLLKYFLAEGVVNKQPLFVCSKEVNPESIVSKFVIVNFFLNANINTR